MTFYRERLWPAPWVFAAITLVIPATLLVFLPINVQVGIVVAIVFYLACGALLIVATPTIEVTGSELRAGSARLPISFVGEVSSYRGAEAVLQRGQRLDARAWLLVRGWIAPVCTIEVTDAADPAPYWLLSSREPEKLAAALEEARRAAASAT